MPTQLELEALHRQESSEHNAKILETKVTRGKADIFNGKVPAGQLPQQTTKKNVLTPQDFVYNQGNATWNYTIQESDLEFDNLILISTQLESGGDKVVYSLPLLAKTKPIKILIGHSDVDGNPHDFEISGTKTIGTFATIFSGETTIGGASFLLNEDFWEFVFDGKSFAVSVNFDGLSIIVNKSGVFNSEI